MNGMTDFLTAVGVLATAGGIAWLGFRAVTLHYQTPPHLRGHFFAATLWTAVTFFQTVSVLIYRADPNFVGRMVAILSGVVMVWSWAQLAERQSGTTLRQERRPLPARLFVQTFWGVLALWIATWGISAGMNDWFDDAITYCDTPTITRLYAAGFRGANGRICDRRDALIQAIRGQDMKAVRTYLAVGVEPDFGTDYYYSQDNPYTEAVSRGDVEITRLLFAKSYYSYSNHTPLLQTAVQSGQLEQARFLLHRGYDVNEAQDGTHSTALKIAKQRGDKPMIAMLKGAGATK